MGKGVGVNRTFKFTVAVLLQLLCAILRCEASAQISEEISLPDDTTTAVTPDSSIPKVRMLIFKSKDCPECVEALETVLPQLDNDYPGQIETEQLEIGEGDNILKLFAFEKKFGDRDNEVPVIFIGDQVIGGPEETREKLPQIVPEILVQGGCDYPVLTAEEIGLASEVREGRKYLAYFHQQGCKDCDRVSYLLLYLGKRFPSLEIQQYDTAVHDNKVLNEAMCVVRDVPEKLRLVTPSIFIGKEYLIENAITGEATEALLDRPEAARKPWDLTEDDSSRGRVQRGGVSYLLCDRTRFLPVCPIDRRFDADTLFDTLHCHSNYRARHRRAERLRLRAYKERRPARYETAAPRRAETEDPAHDKQAVAHAKLRVRCGSCRIRRVAPGTRVHRPGISADHHVGGTGSRPAPVRVPAACSVQPDVHSPASSDSFSGLLRAELAPTRGVSPKTRRRREARDGYTLLRNGGTIDLQHRSPMRHRFKDSSHLPQSGFQQAKRTYRAKPGHKQER